MISKLSSPPPTPAPTPTPTPTRFPDLPLRMRALPVDARGFPVPYFVKWFDGVPDFTVVDPEKFGRAVRFRRCWICGEVMGRHMAFVVGPMCCVNRISGEPPSHLTCARFALKACPFLTRPLAKRKEQREGTVAAPGMIERNPGVSALWVTGGYEVVEAQGGLGNVLIEMGAPELVEWWAHGRKATAEEIEDSVEAGMPALVALCETAEDRREHEEQVARFRREIFKGRTAA